MGWLLCSLIRVRSLSRAVCGAVWVTRGGGHQCLSPGPEPLVPAGWPCRARLPARGSLQGATRGVRYRSCQWPLSPGTSPQAQASLPRAGMTNKARAPAACSGAWFLLSLFLWGTHPLPPRRESWVLGGSTGAVPFPGSLPSRAGQEGALCLVPERGCEAQSCCTQVWCSRRSRERWACGRAGRPRPPDCGPWV